MRRAVDFLGFEVIPSDTQFGGQGVEATDTYELIAGVASAIQWWALCKGKARQVTVTGTDSRTGISVAFDGRAVCFLTTGAAAECPAFHVGFPSECYTIPVQRPVDIMPRRRIRRYEILNILITLDNAL